MILGFCIEIFDFMQRKPSPVKRDLLWCGFLGASRSLEREAWKWTRGTLILPVNAILIKSRDEEQVLQDKRIDLDAVKRKTLIERILQDISRTHGDLYYQPTSTIALLLHQKIHGGAQLNAEEKELLEPLTQRDIEVLLSLH